MCPEELHLRQHLVGQATPAVRRSLTYVVGLVFLLSGGCFQGRRPEKTPGSALWLGREAPAIAAEDLERLVEADVSELFVELAALTPGAARPLVREPLPELPASTPITMVVTGERSPGAAAGRARELASALRQIRFDVEAAGLIPVGFHFDLDALGSGAASFFGALRSELDPALFLSLSLRRAWLDEPGLEQLVREVDFVVPFLYGQRPSESDADDAWDFEVLGERLATLEDLDVPYYLGVIGLGTVRHQDKRGKTKAKSAEQTLYPFLWNRALKLEAGYSLEGTHRRAYALVAEGATKAGGWSIATGDEIHLVGPSTTDLKELLSLASPEVYPRLLGQVFYRLPAPREGLSLTVDNILSALGPEPVTPDLTFEVQVQRRTLRGLLLRFFIVNRNGEITELSIDSNYLQITAEAALIAEEVELGDFYRYDLLRASPGGEPERTFRNPNVLRLFVPMLTGQQKVSSGDVEIRPQRPRLRLEGHFLLPDGRTIDVGPYSWSNGKLTDESAAAASSGS